MLQVASWLQALLEVVYVISIYICIYTCSNGTCSMDTCIALGSSYSRLGATRG